MHTRDAQRTFCGLRADSALAGDRSQPPGEDQSGLVDALSMQQRDTDTIIGRRVLAAIRESRVTHDDLAQQVGMSRRSLQRRLIGERSFFMPELMRLALALDRPELPRRVIRGL